MFSELEERLVMDQTTAKKKAVLYRMVMPGHVCPFGLKSKDLLERHGYAVEDHPLTSREETDAFKAKHDVKTTPQTFIGDTRVGGHSDLRQFFGEKVKGADETSYRPVIVLFTLTALTALGAAYVATGSALSLLTIEWFIAFSMVVLALLKLQDVEQFSTMFLNYDLLARKWVRYGYVYPYAEGAAGLLMVAGILTWLSAPVAFFIGTVGAISVFKAVYIDKRELKCACVGGSSNVPLGFISLTENVMMVAMAIWMALGALGIVPSGHDMAMR